MTKYAAAATSLSCSVIAVVRPCCRQINSRFTFRPVRASSPPSVMSTSFAIEYVTTWAR